MLGYPVLRLKAAESMDEAFRLDRTRRAYNCIPVECSLCVSGQDAQYVNIGVEMLATMKSSNPSPLGNPASHNYDFHLIPRRLPATVLVAKYH